MLHLSGEVSLFSQNQNVYKKNFTNIVHYLFHQVFADFTWSLFGFSHLFCMQVKLELLLHEIVSALGNKEPLICSRVYGKSAVSAQTDGDG